MVRPANLDGLRSANFGIDGCTNPLHPDCIRAEVERYNAADAAAVSRRVRNEVGLVETAGRWIALYRPEREEFRNSQRDFHEELRALGRYVARWNYGKRVDWKLQQLERIRKIPLIGGGLWHLAVRFLRRYGEL